MMICLQTRLGFVNLAHLDYRVGRVTTGFLAVGQISLLVKNISRVSFII